MSERQPYSRLYWSVFDDERFAGIRGDMRHFGSWSVMLLVADMAYPASAYVPPVVSRASLAALVDAGLIETQAGGLFRVHGLQAERTRRADAARRGGNRDPDGRQTGGNRPTRRDEPSLDTPRARQDEFSQGVVSVDERRVIGTYPPIGVARPGR